MQTLKDILTAFSFVGTNEEKLTSEFAKLAPYFISDGYIKVRDDFRIYPTTVEFYIHSEKSGIKDYIVYHRNNKFVQGAIPYFPIMTLHAHDSGYDITFENAKEEYRASVLIRAYQVWDVKHRCWLKWNAKEQLFCPYTTEDKTPINTQVLYLKFLLNGFPMDGGNLVSWVDATELIAISAEDGKPRKGVDLYDENGIRLKGQPDKRPWSFSRKEFIESI